MAQSTTARTTKPLMVRIDSALVDAIQADATTRGQPLTVWITRAASAWLDASSQHAGADAAKAKRVGKNADLAKPKKRAAA